MTIEDIIKSAELATGYDARLNTRSHIVSDTKSVVCYLARTLTGMTVESISDYLGVHYTDVVYHSKKAIKMLSINDSIFKSIYISTLRHLYDGVDIN